MSQAITPVVMPKWGLEMREGQVVSWLVREGDTIAPGQPLLDIETDKLSNTYEAPDGGLLRRIVAREGSTLPVKALLAVLAPPEVSDAQVDAFVDSYTVPQADDAAGAGKPAFEDVEVRGLRIRHARRGDFDSGRTPVVFLHGFGGDLGNWQFNVDAAAEHSPVVVLDLPGHGQSQIALPAGGLPQLAGLVGDFLQAIGVARAHLVGHSMGGAIAAQLALDRRQVVQSLVLVNSAGLGEDINTDYTRGFAQAQSRRELKGVLEMLFADPGLVSGRLVDEVLRYKRLDGVAELLGGLDKTLFPDGRQAFLPALALRDAPPTLVVWGAEDRIIPARHARAAPESASVEVLEGAGHMTMLEKPAEFNALLRAHVQR